MLKNLVSYFLIFRMTMLFCHGHVILLHCCVGIVLLYYMCVCVCVFILYKTKVFRHFLTRYGHKTLNLNMRMVKEQGYVCLVDLQQFCGVK